jgi:hypothetical protein
MKAALRFGLPAVGAFLLGVFPGMNWLKRYGETSPVMLGGGEVICLILLLATSGSSFGILLFRLVSWTKPTATDAAIFLAYGLLFGLIGFSYLCILVV